MKLPIYFKKMLAQAISARNNAYAPYSKFQVGCCIRTENNLFFAGTNVENVAFGTTQCAEGAAIGAMITAGERKIKDLLLVAINDSPCTPCGNCRQQLSEFAHPDMQVHVCNPRGHLQTIKFTDLLPYSFKF